MATAVGEAVADVAEVVAEEATDVAVSARNISGREVGLLLGGSGLGMVIGATAAYFILRGRLATSFEAIADEEIATMREHYDRKLRALENEKEKAMMSEVSEEIKTRQEGDGQVPYHTMYQAGSEPDKAPHPDDDPVVVNVFSNEDPEVEMVPAWDIAEELVNRSPDVPYVVHRSEHEEGPEGPEEYEKYTLTYFEGDDTLCREDDTVITDQDEVVGLGNLSRFGHGSGDPNIVYIRNEKMKVDLEVVHSDGKYAIEVAGFKEDELQHSSMRRRSPRRSEYDSDR